MIKSGASHQLVSGCTITIFAVSPPALVSGVVIECSVCIADMRGDIRSEWDETKQHDVLFLLTLRPPVQAELALLQQDGTELHPAEKFGLAYVRGCEVLEVKDEGVLTLLLTLHC